MLLGSAAQFGPPCVNKAEAVQLHAGSPSAARLRDLVSPLHRTFLMFLNCAIILMSSEDLREIKKIIIQQSFTHVHLFSFPNRGLSSLPFVPLDFLANICNFPNKTLNVSLQIFRLNVYFYWGFCLNSRVLMKSPVLAILIGHRVEEHEAF